MPRLVPRTAFRLAIAWGVTVLAGLGLGYGWTWWRRGAEHGDADGQAMLGAALHLGAGVPRDPIAACAWLLRAEQGGSALAGQFLKPAQASLAPSDLAEAERRAALPLESSP